jgi:hypothetical protein
LKDLKQISSASKEGLSTVRVEFNVGVDIDEALRRVRDKVNTAKTELPTDILEQVISEINFSEFPIMFVNVGGNFGIARLKKIAEDLQDKFEAIPGMLRADLSGGLEPEVKVNDGLLKLHAKLGVPLVATNDFHFLRADDHAAHAMSAYGSRINRTPNLDRIAEDGVRLTHCFCTNSICTPSRATILTGQYGHVSGVRSWEPLDNRRPVQLQKLLQSAGYTTALMGKWHLGHGVTSSARPSRNTHNAASGSRHS